VNRLPRWGWLLIGFGVGALLVGTPVVIYVNRFIRSLDEATGWGAWSGWRRR
jgi:hypothetical protein